MDCKHSSAHPGRGGWILTERLGEIDKKLSSKLPSSDEKREKLAKRQANAAVALLRMNQAEKVWPLLKPCPDPRVRSYLIHRLSPLGADVNDPVKRLDEERDLTIRRALLLSLGEFDEKEFTLEDRKGVLPKVKNIYQTAADLGLHASAEWLLRIRPAGNADTGQVHSTTAAFAVAMNLDSGEAKLVLLCPAWKNWGTANTVKPGTVILHSRADDVVSFADSEELVRNSGLPVSAMVEVGTDHRLADLEPLRKILEASEGRTE